MAETAYVPRLRTQFDREIRGKLTEQFGYGNIMQVPRLEKVVLNMGVGGRCDCSGRLPFLSSVSAIDLDSGTLGDTH